MHTIFIYLWFALFVYFSYSGYFFIVIAGVFSIHFTVCSIVIRFFARLFSLSLLRAHLLLLLVRFSLLYCHIIWWCPLYYHLFNMYNCYLAAQPHINMYVRACVCVCALRLVHKNHLNNKIYDFCILFPSISSVPFHFIEFVVCFVCVCVIVLYCIMSKYICTLVNMTIQPLSIDWKFSVFVFIFHHLCNQPPQLITNQTFVQIKNKSTKCNQIKEYSPMKQYEKGPTEPFRNEINKKKYAQTTPKNHSQLKFVCNIVVVFAAVFFFFFGGFDVGGGGDLVCVYFHFILFHFDSRTINHIVRNITDDFVCRRRRCCCFCWA